MGHRVFRCNRSPEAPTVFDDKVQADPALSDTQMAMIETGNNSVGDEEEEVEEVLETRVSWRFTEIESDHHYAVLNKLLATCRAVYGPSIGLEIR